MLSLAFLKFRIKDALCHSPLCLSWNVTAPTKLSPHKIYPNTILALRETSVFRTWSEQLMFSILRRHFRCNWSKVWMWRRYTVHVSVEYRMLRLIYQPVSKPPQTVVSNNGLIIYIINQCTQLQLLVQQTWRWLRTQQLVLACVWSEIGLCRRVWSKNFFGILLQCSTRYMLQFFHMCIRILKRFLSLNMSCLFLNGLF